MDPLIVLVVPRTLMLPGCVRTFAHPASLTDCGFRKDLPRLIDLFGLYLRS